MSYQLPVPTQKQYAWNFPIKADPNAVGAEIEEIWEEKNGQIQPVDLVNRARSESSAMHTLFEWDDSIAAGKYREAQGAYILRHIRVSTSDQVGEKTIYVGAFINVVTTEGRFYSPVSIVKHNDEQREYALREARNSLMAWRRKYAAYTEFFEIHQTIDRLIADDPVTPGRHYISKPQ